MSGVAWRWWWGGEPAVDGGHLGLVLVGGLVHVTASVVRPGRQPVVLDEPEAPAPRPGSLELRAPGLWVDAVVEEPGRRWTVGLEAFALEVDDPTDTVGVRVPLGLDLEWEATGPAGSDGAVPAIVRGEVLVGADAVDLDAIGGWLDPGGADPAG